MKVAICSQFGGFGLSDKAYLRLAELGVPVYPIEEDHPDEFCIYDNGKTNSLSKNRYYRSWHVASERADPRLIQVVEELGQEAAGMCCTLKIVEIPDRIEFEIDEYDGLEKIEEPHRSWS